MCVFTCETCSFRCLAGIQGNYLVSSQIGEPGVQGRSQLEDASLGAVSVEMMFRAVVLSEMSGASGDKEVRAELGADHLERAG